MIDSMILTGFPTIISWFKKDAMIGYYGISCCTVAS
jgi:NADH:ubiquinone oxidoreductase subunit B-like Fe-S oxidoreductase